MIEPRQAAAAGVPRRALLARAVGLASAVVLAGTVAGCAAAAPGDGSADGSLRVVTTTNFITDTAEQIGGDRVRVTGLMGAGVDPHLYRAQAGDVRTLQEADVVFWNGLELESKMAEVFTELGETRPVVAVSEAIPPERRLPAGTTGTEYDPHTWFDPTRWEFAARAIADAYRRADPHGSAYYDQRLKTFLGALRDLDAYARQRLAAVPERSRVLVTSHDAFGYFADAYGFDLAPIQGISTQAEATTADIQRVAGVIATRQVRTVFVESSVPRQTIEAVLAAARRQGREAGIGGQLYGDNAGERGSPQGSYVGALRHNVDLIADGLR